MKVILWKCCFPGIFLRICCMLHFKLWEYVFKPITFPTLSWFTTTLFTMGNKRPEIQLRSCHCDLRCMKQPSCSNIASFLSQAPRQHSDQCTQLEMWYSFAAGKRDVIRAVKDVTASFHTKQAVIDRYFYIISRKNWCHNNQGLYFLRYRVYFISGYI